MQRILAVLLTVLLLPAASMTQTRRRTATRSTRPATVAKPDQQRQGAQRVADELKVLTKFIYLLGGVAKDLQSVDDAARRNEVSPAAIENAKQGKATVRSSIEQIREALDKLEIDFRNTPELQRYYIKLAGVAAGAASAEDFAAANQFDKAGRTLLEVVNRLTDVLLEMR